MVFLWGDVAERGTLEWLRSRGYLIRGGTNKPRKISPSGEWGHPIFEKSCHRQHSIRMLCFYLNPASRVSTLKERPMRPGWVRV